MLNLPIVVVVREFKDNVNKNYVWKMKEQEGSQKNPGFHNEVLGGDSDAIDRKKKMEVFSPKKVDEFTRRHNDNFCRCQSPRTKPTIMWSCPHVMCSLAFPKTKFDSLEASATQSEPRLSFTLPRP